jgi:biotin carboxyl carrier protein
VQPTEAGLEVLLQGRLYVVEVEDERQRTLRESSSGQARDRGQFCLRSPMPGLIVAVPVAEGQAVTRGQDLVVLESMKMQNELKAPRDGVVGDVRVHAGDRVEHDQILLTVD